MTTMFLLLFLTGMLNLTALIDSTPATPPRIYLSTDLGTNWEAFDDGLPPFADVYKVKEVEDKLFLLAMTAGVYVMPKGETTWKSSSNGLAPKTMIISIAGKGNLFVLGTADHGVYISSDGGANWRRPFFNIKSSTVRSILFHENAILAATDFGIWRSYDNGETWKQDGVDLTLINEMTIHNGQIHVAKQNGMGILKGKKIEWANVETEWAIGPLFSQGEYLYAVPARGNMIRSKDGVNWEHQGFHIKLAPANNLPEALWDGYKPDLPQEENMPFPSISRTSRGWVTGMSTGC